MVTRYNLYFSQLHSAISLEFLFSFVAQKSSLDDGNIFVRTLKVEQPKSEDLNLCLSVQGEKV